MASAHRTRKGESDECYVPPEVIEAINQLSEGRTADEDDLDDALLF